MKQKREGGSVPGFIVVAILLIGLLVGGAYFVQQQSHNKPVTSSPGQPSESEQKPVEGSTPPPANDVPHAPQGSSPATQGQEAHKLPQSGPGDTALTILVLGLVTGAVASYVQSRRQLAPL